MKHLIILGDGMADRAYKSLGNKTLLQYAHTPYMDLLAKKGRVGQLRTVPDGFHPGSEVANLSVLGYDLSKVFEGRGVLEAASMGIDIQPGDLAFRCNLICVEGEQIKNHSAGHIDSVQSAELIDYLNEHLGSEEVTFYKGISYRHLLVIRGGDKRIDCAPPHDFPLHPFFPLLPKSLCSQATSTTELLVKLILQSQELLKKHPINLKRCKEGVDSANSIWPWSPGYRPSMPLFTKRFASVRSGVVISAVDLIKGIGKYAGLQCPEIEGATGLHDTNYANKVQATLSALETNDFVYLHVEASDEAGHEGDRDLKIKTIEDLDSQVIGPLYEALKGAREKVAIAVLPDHPTPCDIRTHTADPVPFLIYQPGLKPDKVTCFDEVSVKEGVYKLLEKDQFINYFLQ